jgi:hypothetical protein
MGVRLNRLVVGSGYMPCGTQRRIKIYAGSS